MSRVALLLLVFGVANGFQSNPGSPGGSAADLARAIRETGLDPAECYRVRDLSFVKDDIKLYLNDGYLIFSKPVLGQRLSAVFTTDVEGGDGEAIVIPPTRSERESLAGFTQSPNLDEHFRAVLMVSTEGSVGRLLQSLEHEASAKKAPEMGTVLAEQWGPVVSNISGPMQMRLVEDLWSSRSSETGMAFFAVSGKTLGNFDILSDARAGHRMMVRQHIEREGHDDFNVWTDFIPRQFARENSNATGTTPLQEFKLSHYRIATEIASDLSVKAVTRVTLRTGRDAVRVFPFEMARAMQVNAVRIDGMPAELMRDESQRGRITGNGEEFEFLAVAPADLPANSEHEFEFEHQGNVIATRGDGVYFVSARGSWYPHTAGQFATFDLSFRYPKRLTLVAGGDPLEDRIDGDWRITRRNMTVAVAAAGFNLGVYEKVTGTAAGVNYEVYGNRNLEQALRPPVMFSTPDAGAAAPGSLRSRGARSPDTPLPVVIPAGSSGETAKRSERCLGVTRVL